MANVVLITGNTGTGKSRSLKDLNPKETYLINCANKPLPFVGSGNLYQSGVNMIVSNESGFIVSAIKQVSEKAPHIKNLIIDDSGFIMTELFFKKASEKGYEKFTEIAKAFQSILSTAKSLRDDLNIAIIMHEDDLVSNGIIVGKKAKTVGKLVDDQYNPLSVVTVALFTDVSYDKEGNPIYSFITNRCLRQGIEIPAKSPEGMFPDRLIPNNLSLVFKTAREYYSN
ncbi:MAG: hypothetical protein EKK63_02580 [Acinetobacter sp.]|uniref:hypothetical protein n=1 Tax=Acinetobacter sp. TaxID=472 RepID=UPI000FB6F019|nr:hypothetical protein [Acinetobacter sp.]RUP42203.1 MAG: hypothetical protein EKK63_02580 [Acinetobacter sp.]